MIKYFKKLAAKCSLKGVQGADFIRKARAAMGKPYSVLLIDNKEECNALFLLSTLSRLSPKSNSDPFYLLNVLILMGLYIFTIHEKPQKSSQLKTVHKLIHRMFLRGIPTIAKSFPPFTGKNSCFHPVCGIL
ncbi:hypothetical protein [Kosakonia cowanii]|uniref:hypothetical protein n=1 Tax=Kosakonia TaxID=1330547 RepID=UPI002730FB54|nr:hypothetical protein [Kosakonia cowanii]WKW42372.1 hypothetical protein PZO50_22795 [Kosakonia cowanii]